MTTRPFQGTFFDVVEAVLCAWVGSILPPSVVVYQAMTPTPRPTSPSVTIMVKDIRQIGYDYVNPPATTTAVEQGVITGGNYGVYEVTFTFYAYASEPFVCMQALQAIRQALQSDSYVSLVKALQNGFSFLRFSGSAFDVSLQQAQSDLYMTRVFAQDIVFCCVNIYNNDTGEINIVNAIANLYSPDNTLVASEPFTASTP